MSKCHQKRLSPQSMELMARLSFRVLILKAERKVPNFKVQGHFQLLSAILDLLQEGSPLNVCSISHHGSSAYMFGGNIPHSKIRTPTETLPTFFRENMEDSQKPKKLHSQSYHAHQFWPPHSQAASFAISMLAQEPVLRSLGRARVLLVWKGLPINLSEHQVD